MPGEEMEQGARRLVTLEARLSADQIEILVGDLEQPFEVVDAKRVKGPERLRFRAGEIID
jgi:hypothetical protein